MVYIIAEFGNTHEGSVGLCKSMMSAAKASGADAVKMQTHMFDQESLEFAPNPPYFNGESRRSYFERTSFNVDQYIDLFSFGRNELGIDMFSSPFSVDAVELLEAAGVSQYKVASGEVTNVPLLRSIGGKGKPVFLSSGMSSWKDLELAVDELRTAGCGPLTVMQCSSIYPCGPQHVGLNVIGEIHQRFNCQVGFSDHTLGPAAAISAVTLGATVVEKHFTLSNLMYGSDATNSMEPDQFKLFSRYLRDTSEAIQSPVDKDQLSESLSEMKIVFQKSLVTTQSIRAGSVLEASMLTAKKPGSGIPASFFDKVVGRVVNTNLPKNHMISATEVSDFDVN